VTAGVDDARTTARRIVEDVLEAHGAELGRPSLHVRGAPDTEAWRTARRIVDEVLAAEELGQGRDGAGSGAAPGTAGPDRIIDLRDPSPAEAARRLVAAALADERERRPTHDALAARVHEALEPLRRPPRDPDPVRVPAPEPVPDPGPARRREREAPAPTIAAERSTPAPTTPTAPAPATPVPQPSAPPPVRVEARRAARRIVGEVLEDHRRREEVLLERQRSEEQARERARRELERLDREDRDRERLARDRVAQLREDRERARREDEERRLAALEQDRLEREHRERADPQDEQQHEPDRARSFGLPLDRAVTDRAPTAAPRTGRWLLATMLGALALAVLFPLAVAALRELVSLS
jgi:hypothetical protein